MKNTLYRKNYDEYGMYYYTKLYPTGKWKISTDIHGDIHLYIEIKFMYIFFRWMHESNLHIGYKKTEVINDCNT